MWVFSPKFSDKTGITPNDIFGEVQRADNDVSVVLFSSHWKQVSVWPNVWIQGETFHPGLLAMTNKIIEQPVIKLTFQNLFNSK